MPDPLADGGGGKGATRPALDDELRDLWPRCMRQLMLPCRMELPYGKKGGQPKALIRGGEVDPQDFHFERAAS